MRETSKTLNYIFVYNLFFFFFILFMFDSSKVLCFYTKELLCI